MPRPETDIAATRTRIMDAAEHIIQERGSISFTMTDLATAVGMSPSNLYRFFESKDALAMPTTRACLNPIWNWATNISK